MYGCGIFIDLKKAIEQKEYVKYLGVLLDSKLSFCHHISSIIKKISRAIGIMRKMKRYVSKNVLTCLYYSLVYPFLIYAIPIQGSYSFLQILFPDISLTFQGYFGRFSLTFKLI